MLYKELNSLIGNTRLLYLSNLSSKYNNNIYVKLEGDNPFGSIKDRVAYQIIKKGIEENKIDKATVIIEATSGNTGIALAGICKTLGLKFIVIMPENMSIERINIMKLYGAEVLLTQKEEGMNGSIKKSLEIQEKYSKDGIKTFMPDQFNNENNYLVHYLTTARELDNDLKEIDYIFSGIGTGGTITGIGKYFKENNCKTKIIGYEPKESPFLTEGRKGLHGIQGIGAGFKPSIYNENYVDDVLQIETNNAYETCMELLEAGLFLGISSGGAFASVKKYIEDNNITNKNIVFISPDNGMKYMSFYNDMINK